MPKPKHYVVCVNNDGYDASLVVRRIYEAVPDELAAGRGLVRVVDESGQDYLFPAAFFEAIDLPKALERKLASTR